MKQKGNIFRWLNEYCSFYNLIWVHFKFPGSDGFWENLSAIYITCKCLEGQVQRRGLSKIVTENLIYHFSPGIEIDSDSISEKCTLNKNKSYYNL